MTNALLHPSKGSRSGVRPAERAASRSARGRPVRCGGCSKEFEARAWQALPVVRIMSSEAVAPHVVKWPAGARIEIRRCSRCDRPIARTDGSVKED